MSQKKDTRKLSPPKCCSSKSGEMYDTVLAELDRNEKQFSHQRELEAECLLREQEIWQLQQAISASHMQLYSERCQLLALQKVNDELRLTSQEQNRQIRALQAHCQLQNCRHPDCSLSLSRQSSPDKKFVTSSEKTATCQGKFISLKNDIGSSLAKMSETALIERIEALQIQIIEQAKFHEERLSAVLQDREVQKKEAEAYHNSASQKVRDLTDRLGKTETALQQTARNFILGKRSTIELQKSITALELEAEQANLRWEEERSQIGRKASQQLKNALKQSQSNGIESRKTIREQSDKIQRLEKDLNVMEQSYRDHIAKLEEQLNSVLQKLHARDKRGALTLEGWANDVSILRKRMDVIARKCQQLSLIERLPDDERLDALMEKLEKRAPDFESDSEEGSIASSTQKPSENGAAKMRKSSGKSHKQESPEEELVRVQNGIKALELRLLQAAQHEAKYQATEDS